MTTACKASPALSWTIWTIRDQQSFRLVDHNRQFWRPQHTVRPNMSNPLLTDTAIREQAPPPLPTSTMVELQLKPSTDPLAHKFGRIQRGLLIANPLKLGTILYDATLKHTHHYRSRRCTQTIIWSARQLRANLHTICRLAVLQLMEEGPFSRLTDLLSVKNFARCLVRSKTISLSHQEGDGASEHGQKIVTQKFFT